ncbi:MAG: Ppx/GppA phosphatase family protein [Nitrospinaceae bacterium]
MKKIASIDIGSNTVRLLILESGPGGDFRIADSERVITRLGEGIDAGKGLQEKRMDETLAALCRFREKCRDHGDIAIHAVATSAVREAPNRDEFLKRAKEAAGIHIEVIPWEEEARLTLQGVFWKIPHGGRKILTFDIGGGSTEFILSNGDQVAESVGTPLGTVRLTEKFITRHPVDETEYRNLENHLRGEMVSIKDRLSEFAPETLIGTAGTVTTLAALDKNIFPYDPEKVHGAVIPINRVQSILEDLKSKSIKERLLMKPLEQGREDLIIAGGAIVLETMRAFSCNDLTVCEHGLREGIILKALPRS